MVFRVEDIQQVCKVLGQLSAPVNSNVMSQVLELKSVDNTLHFHISDTGFDFTTSVALVQPEELHAVVESSLFLNLISKITTETVTISIENNSLVVVANGRYTLPIIYKDSNMLEVPTMDLKDVSYSWNMDGDFLCSVFKHNLELCANPIVVDPLQKQVYIDSQGAVTFSTRACINTQANSSPVKLLLPMFVVKTFPLYKGKDVHVSFGYETVSDLLNQPRIVFEAESYRAVYCLPFTDQQLNEYPVEDVRALGTEKFDYSIILATKDIQGALERIAVFTQSEILQYINFEFDFDKLTIKAKNNKEVIYYDKPIGGLTSPYVVELDLFDVRPSIDASNTFTTIHFGNPNGISIIYGNICNVISLIEE